MNPRGLKFVYCGADVGKWILLVLQRVHHAAKIYRNVTKGTQGPSTSWLMTRHHYSSMYYFSYVPVNKRWQLKIKANLPFHFPFKGTGSLHAVFLCPAA